jgi:hypothetical protein
VEAEVTVRNIVDTNRFVRQLISETTNRRHRFLLKAYDRHRSLEMAGRYQELFAPDMMVPEPVYHLAAHGVQVRLEGRDMVESMYRSWAESNETVFYVEKETIAVSDDFVSSVSLGYHQISGRSLRETKIVSYLPKFASRYLLNVALNTRRTGNGDAGPMYLYKNTFYMIWRYDDLGRLIGESVWEPEPGAAEILKLDRREVVTVAEAAQLLSPLIEPLPPYDDFVREHSTSFARVV